MEVDKDVTIDVEVPVVVDDVEEAASGKDVDAWQAGLGSASSGLHTRQRKLLKDLLIFLMHLVCINFPQSVHAKCRGGSLRNWKPLEQTEQRSWDFFDAEIIQYKRGNSLRNKLTLSVWFLLANLSVE